MSQVSFNNYDSEQYQMLMANFQNLIQSTQEAIQRQQAPNNQNSGVNSPQKNESKYSSSPNRARDKTASFESKQHSPPKIKQSPSKAESRYQSPSQITIPYKYIACQCGFEETVKRQQKDIDELKLRLDLNKPLDLGQLAQDAQSRPIIHAEYLQDLLTEISQKNQQLQEYQSINHIFEQEIKLLQQAFLNEQGSHNQTQSKFNTLQNKYNQLNDQIHDIEKREFQMSDKLTKEYSDLVIENIQLKDQQKQSTAQVNKFKMALNQVYLNQNEKTHCVLINTSVQTEDLFSKMNSKRLSDETLNEKKMASSNLQFLNMNLLKDDEQLRGGKSMRQVLKEKIEKSQYNTDKFILLFLEEKKLKNRSQNEVKFYTELGRMLERIKENYSQLSEAFQQYTQEQDHREAKVRQSLDQTVRNVTLLKENTEIEMQQLQGQLQLKDVHHQEQQSKLNDYKSQLQVLKKQLYEAQTNNQGLQRTNDQLKEKMEEYLSELQDKNQEMQNQMASHNQIKSTLESSIKNLRQELSEQKKYRQQLEFENNQLKSELQQVQQSLQIAEDNQQNIQCDLEEASNQLKSAYEQLRTKSQEVMQLKDQMVSLSNELNHLLQQDEILNQQNDELQHEKQILYESVDKFQHNNKEMFERQSHLELQQSQRESDNKYLRSQIMQQEESLLQKDQQSYDLRSELDNMKFRFEQMSQECSKYQELSSRSQEERNKFHIISKTTEQNLKERQSEIERFSGDIQYKSQRITYLERDLQNQSSNNVELQSMVQATEQELRMLQDYHDQTLNQLEKSRITLSNLIQTLKDKEADANELELQLKNQEIQTEKEKSGLHADYQQRIGVFQSKIMLQEEELKQLQHLLKETSQQINFQKSTNDKGTKWEELLETSYFYNKQSQIKIKVLTQETQRLSQLLDTQKNKNRDLQSFIEKMIENSEENRLLAKQILVEQYDLANQRSQVKNEIQNWQHEEPEQDYNNFNSNETFGRNESQQSQDYRVRTPSNKKNRI